MRHPDDYPVNFPVGTRDRSYCEDCVYDEGLLAAVGRNPSVAQCSHCGCEDSCRDEAELLEAVFDGVNAFYAEPIEVLAWDNEDGDYVGETLLTSEVLDAEGVELGDGLLQAIDTVFGPSTWSRRDYYALSPGQRLQYGWKAFARHVQRRCRFVFLGLETPEDERDHDEIPPAELLPVLAAAAEQAGLFREIDVEHPIFRAYMHPEAEPIERTATGRPDHE